MPEEFYRSEKDFWIEMSIREIWTQTHFAEISYKNIDIKAAANVDVVFSSIHSFLAHCAMVSKLLKSSSQQVSIGNILGVSDNSIIHNRRFRNKLEHYDEELKRWIRQKGTDANIGTYNIGPKSAIDIPNIVYIRVILILLLTLSHSLTATLILNNFMMKLKRLKESPIVGLKTWEEKK